eukprot:118070-Prorocentrum_lima.AAC.1
MVRKSPSYGANTIVSCLESVCLGLGIKFLLQLEYCRSTSKNMADTLSSMPPPWSSWTRQAAWPEF